MHIIFIKFIFQMENYLTIWFNAGNIYTIYFSSSRKILDRKESPS